MVNEKLWWAWGTASRGTSINGSQLGLPYSASATWSNSSLTDGLNASGNATWTGESELSVGSLSSQEYDLILTIVIATILGFLILATIIAMNDYWIGFISACAFFVIMNIPMSSGQVYEVDRQKVYADDGSYGTIICTYYPDTSTPYPGYNGMNSPVKYPFRRSLRRRSNKRYARSNRRAKSLSRKLKIGRGEHRHQKLPSWMPKIPMPVINLDKLPKPKFPPLPKFPSDLSNTDQGASGINANYNGNNFGRHKNKSISWSYSNGKSSVNINYSRANTKDSDEDETDTDKKSKFVSIIKDQRQ